MSIDPDAFRAAEERMYADAGIPETGVTDHRVHLPTLDVTVRVREVGEGDPLLFLHGGPNSGGTWAYLAADLPGFRCLLLDRPGTGLSDPLPTALHLHTLDAYATTLAVDVLDALSIGQVHLVASSFGGMIALRSAAAHPERFGRMVQMGCPAFAPDMKTPPFMRVVLSPLRVILSALPPSEKAGRAILRQIGHGHSLDADRIPQAFHDWYLSLGRDTDTMANEQAMIATGGSFWRGFDTSMELTPAQLSAVQTPTHFIWGGEDTFGGPDVAEQLVAALPDASLETWQKAGHLPWLDDPEQAATAVTKFLRA